MFVCFLIVLCFIIVFGVVVLYLVCLLSTFDLFNCLMIWLFCLML